MKPASILWLLLSGSLCAAPQNYLDTIPVFWRSLYATGAEGLYCGQPVERYDRRFNIEHVYPMSWVTKSLKCKNRKSCRRNSARFNEIEADMHNMYPARKDLNKARAAMGYGMVEGERLVEPGCDMEIDRRKRRVEPRPGVRGNIARAMLYLSDRYQLRLYKKQRKTLLRWHREDPVDAEEKRREAIIRRIQGNANHWVYTSRR